MDRPTWEKQMQEVYKKLASYSPPKNPHGTLPESGISTGEEPERCIGIRVMDESWAYTLLEQLC
jgi:hypothetical protein